MMLGAGMISSRRRAAKEWMVWEEGAPGRYLRHIGGPGPSPPAPIPVRGRQRVAPKALLRCRRNCPPTVQLRHRANYAGGPPRSSRRGARAT